MDSRKSRGAHRRDDEADRKRRFAKALARAEFGRHYWDDDAEAELAAARKRKPGKLTK